MLKITPILALKLLAVCGAFLAIAYLAACVYLYLRQKRFIFFPQRTINQTPADLNLDYEDIWLSVEPTCEQAEQLHGWWIPAASPNADVVLYLHGNGSNISANVCHAKRFHQMGLAVMLVDYRGYGCSEAISPCEDSIYHDVETVWHYLTRSRGIDPQKIFLYGHSLGTAIAIEQATRHPQFAGLILEGGFTSMRAMVDCRYRHFAIFPVGKLLTQRFDSVKKIKSLQVPVLFIHGTEDELVPARMSQELFAAANEPKQLFLVPGGHHTDVAEISGEEYLQVVSQFLERARDRQKQLPVC